MLTPGSALGFAWAVIVGLAMLVYAIAYDLLLKTMSTETLIINSVAYAVVVLYIAHRVTKKFMVDVNKNNVV